MRQLTKALGVIFAAAASVYSGQVIGAAPAKPANKPDSKSTDVKLLDDQTDPFSGAGPATQPTTNPSNNPSAPAPSMQTNVDGTFSLNITSGADLVETLRVIGFQAQKSVLPSKDVHSTLPALDLYNVTVHEALEAILKVNGFVYKEQGNFIYVYTAKEAADMEKANRVQSTEVFHLYYTPAANVQALIKPLMSTEGQAALTTPATSGLDSGTKDIGGNSHATEDMIVVTDYTENLDKIRKLLKEIDHRPQQILIEATILRAALTEDNKLGVDFNILGGVDFASLSSSSGQIVNANLSAGSLAGATAGNNISSVGTGTNFTSNITGGLKIGFLNDNFSMFVAALEGITDTTVLANPKVLALNKQKGEVIVGRKDGYLTTTVTESSTVQTVDFLDTGTRLIFRPYIGDDGYIRMEIHPEDSSGGLSSANLPFKITTEVTSNIMVKDGRTIVIGGLFRESSTTSRSQIPGLGNVPWAGALFRNQADQTTREEIIILLTPHIIKDDVAYSEASEELLKQGDQMRIGVRKGMMWWGRERLAETCYECAVSEMSKSNPDRGKAMWHLDCATNLNPKFAEAIQMKQELSGKIVTDVDNSLIRNFVTRQIMAERCAAKAQSDAESLEPTTQPTAMSDEPTTKPGVASSAATAESPSQFMQSFDLSSSPATQPSMTASSESGWSFGSFFGLRRMGSLAPTTQPSEPVKTTITELPTEETEKAQSSDGNK